MQPTLKHFILRQEALSLYRRTIRASRAIPDPSTRRETLAWIRGEIERNHEAADASVIESTMQHMHRELKQIFPGR